MDSQTALFYRAPDGLVALGPEPFPSEDAFQEILAHHPQLLSETLGGRWMLVSREMGVPDDTGSQRWSIDHVFLDQDGVPTLVEVKRREDSRIRREVVGQMLDYLANAGAYWTVDHLRQALERTAPDWERLWTDFLDDDTSPEDFWDRVHHHLLARHFRCLFVADEMPPELVRVIEFLNEQLNPTEVMGLEIQSRRNDQHQLISVARVGETAHAAGRRRTVTRNAVGAKQWIRNQVERTGQVKLADGVAQGYTEITLKTAVTDLKNPQYCGAQGPLLLEKIAPGHYRRATN